MFILLTAFSISFMDNKEELLRVNVEVNDKVQETNDIYLLNKNNYLVKYEIMLDGDSTKDKVLKVLNYLMDIDNSIFSNELSGTIPKGVKILDVICGNQLVTVNFSKKLLDVYFSSIDPFDDSGQYIDKGFNYTCAIFTDNENVMDYLFMYRYDMEKKFNKKVYISLLPDSVLFKAEEYHQDYALKNPKEMEEELIKSGRK